MIALHECAYDHPDAVRLVEALKADIDERYADFDAAWTPEQRAADDAAYLAEVRPELVRPPLGVFIVAELDGAAVACGALKPLDRGAGIGEVKRMYVAPGARRRGLGRRVLEALETRAAELGYRRLQLETGTAQPEALELYAGAGWHVIPSYGRYAEAEGSVCFAKDLAVPVRDRSAPVADGPDGPRAR